MFKIGFFICIVLSGGLTGIIKALSLKERILLIESFKNFILDLEGHMNYFKEPLPELFSQYNKRISTAQRDKNTGNRVLKLINESMSCINEKNGSFGEFWALKAEEIYGDTSLTEDDLEFIKYAGSFIGQTDCDNHKRQFEYLKKTIDLQLNDAKEIYKNKGPMYQKAGFLCGAVGALIFL